MAGNSTVDTLQHYRDYYVMAKAPLQFDFGTYLNPLSIYYDMLAHFYKLLFNFGETIIKTIKLLLTRSGPNLAKKNLGPA